ncbi:protein phosphatase 2C domain-containing protein [Actinomadura opuntiae]|uniref:protein phosphatase 2C domain-containing protein n=1 Tax=Actinomadura sp. OS1-43 TaxID=604315 RepID=UPI00255AA043|nr:protein phosphatase 2C domain-containing protein [Actinomadura sp. OS1-43]MDL4818883.1 protein phosphatase 2C domain-containing protein [Actinomadura sp. OS1-43]
MTDEPTIGPDIDNAAAKPAEPTCPACKEIVYPGYVFCENCGHKLGDPPPAVPGESGVPPREGATIRQSSASLARRRAAGRPCPECGGAAIDADGYCERCGVRQPAERDHVEISLPAAGSPDGSGADGSGALAAAGASDRGRRYSRNEDALALAAHAAGIVAVVSDGVGSSQRPDEASRAAADTAAAELAALLDAGEDPEEATRAAALKAAGAVAALAASPSEAPSCTYVSAVTRGATLTVGWVGDSRAYWLSAQEGATADGRLEDTQPDATRPDGAGDGDAGGDTEPNTGDMAELGPSRQLTEDDSWAAIMVAQGSLTEAEAEAHPNAHVITAWLGADAGEVRPHVATFRPTGPGTLLVCSDGLWNYFPAAADLAALLGGPDGAAGGPAEGTAEGTADGSADGSAGGERPDPAADPLGAARALVQHALEAGGRDNITVAVVPFPSPPVPPRTPPESTEQHR